MTQIWWGRESQSSRASHLVASLGSAQLELLPSSRDAVAKEIRGRIKHFTPEWTNLQSGDAGIALVRLFGEQMEPVLERLNRLPEKAFVEFLNIAGIQPLAARTSNVLLEFEVSSDAAESVALPPGFQVGARAANGGDLVTFEIERPLNATPAKIAEMLTQQGNSLQSLDFKNASDTAPFLPFGKKANPGSSFWIGLSSGVVPGPTLSLGVRVTTPPGMPPPVPAGGVMPLPVPPPPTLRWEVLDSTSMEPANVIVDETSGLLRSGVIELRLPSRWRPGRPSGFTGDSGLRWLRLRIIHGQYPEGPKLSFVKLNVARAIAARTIVDEVLEPVPNSDGRRWQLSQTPVLPGSLILEVQDTAPAATAAPWQEVAELSTHGAEDHVYELDARNGQVTFGDGIHGAAVPIGFRHIRAASYRAGGGASSAVDAGAADTLISSMPFLSSVTNPLAASGGVDRESQLQALRRGPQEIRARERAVTIADYGLLAQRAPGAQIERAYAISGLHASFPGSAIPGVVGVFVVPPDRHEGPPTPDQETLRAVAQFLSQEAAPVGVEVVVASPRYHKIRAEVGILVKRDANAGETVRRVVNRLDQYFHPLLGGDDKEGWPFGGPLRYARVLSLITNIEGVRAVPRVNFIVDGFRIRACTDHAIGPEALFWPGGHQVVVLDEERSL